MGIGVLEKTTDDDDYEYDYDEGARRSLGKEDVMDG